MKDYKTGRKSLTFDQPAKSVKTKAGRFLQGKITHQPFAKKICVEKKFTRKYQTYLEVTVSGNHHGIKRWDHFVKKFRAMIGALIEFEPKLVIKPFPDSKDSIKARPFMHKASTLASSGSC